MNKICFQSSSRQLYTSLDLPDLGTNHNLMIRDEDTPLDATGQPLFAPAWRYLLGDDCTITNNNVLQEPEWSVQLFPNPFNEEIVIRFNSDDIINYTLRVYSYLGQEILRKEGHGSERLIIDERTLPDGVYFYHIQDNDVKRSVTGKLMKIGED